MGAAVATLPDRGRRTQSALRAVLRAIGHALPLLFSGRLLGKLVLWTALAFLAWLLIAIAAVRPVTDAIAGAVGATSAGTQVLIGFAVLLIFMAGAIVSALMIVAAFAMPAIVRLVADRYYPDLQRRQGGRWHGSLRNAVFTLLVFIPAWLAALLLLELPPVYLVVSWCLSGWFNQRLFRYDALSEHADPVELARLPREIRGRLFALGVIFAPLTLIPIVNLAMPLFAGIAFTCLCLDELARRRAAAA
jgi:CysZ protein